MRQSSGVVILKFDGSPATQRTVLPSRSTSMASSVACHPPRRARSCASTSQPRLNACGVWRRRGFRGTVFTMRPVPSCSAAAHSFKVSATGTHGTLPRDARPRQSDFLSFPGSKRPRCVMHEHYIRVMRNMFQRETDALLARRAAVHCDQPRLHPAADSFAASFFAAGLRGGSASTTRRIEGSPDRSDTARAIRFFPASGRNCFGRPNLRPAGGGDYRLYDRRAHLIRPAMPVWHFLKQTRRWPGPAPWTAGARFALLNCCRRGGLPAAPPAGGSFSTEKSGWPYSTARPLATSTFAMRPFARDTTRS